MLSPLRRSATDSIRYRSFATSSATALPIGFFARPPVAPQANVARVTRGSAVAKPHTPPNVPKTQAPNKEGTWSESQNPRDLAMRGPRFEQVTFDLQPLPLSAMEMVSREPIRLTQSRTATCDGGDGPLGHPKVFINLDKPGPKACPYCGIRFEKDHQHHHA